METVFDVRAFGARGDGAADDTEAIRAALAAAAPCRGTVLVPPGKYVCGRLTMAPGVRLEGRSAWSFRSYGASELLLRGPDEGCLIDVTGAFGCSIAGMSLNGRRLGENVHGVSLHWEKYNGGSEEDTPTIDDCRIGDFSGDGVHLSHVWCFSVRHSMLCHNGGAGLMIDGWDGFLLDNWFSGNRNCGILASPHVSSITATGNRVEWNRVAGFYIASGNSWNVTGNFFDRSGGPAIRMGRGVADCAISGNVFRRSGKPDGVTFASPYDSAHLFFEGASNVSVAGNTFIVGRDDGGRGVLSPEYGVVLRGCRAMAVTGNVWQNGALTKNLVAEDCREIELAANVGGEAQKPQYV